MTTDPTPPNTPRRTDPNRPPADQNVSRHTLPPSSQEPSQPPQNALNAASSTISFQKSLEAWKNDPYISNKEKEFRVTAAERIQTCYREKSTSLDLIDLELTSLPNLSSLITLTKIDLSGNNLTAVDLQGLSNLTEINLSNNKLTSVSLLGFSSLEELYIDNNQLTSVCWQGLSELKVLSLSSNRLTLVDLQGLSNLTEINLSENNLTAVDLQGLSLLVEIDIRNNKLTSMNLNGLSNLTSIDLSDNKLSSVDLQGLSNLTSIDLSDNKLSSVNLQGLSNLTKVILLRNDLTSVLLQGLSNLKEINLSGNKLSSINLQGLSNLENLDLAGNQLLEVDLQGLFNLKLLDLAINRLTSVSLLGLSALERLNISENLLPSFGNITLPSPSNLVAIFLRRNPFLVSERESTIVTMRIPSGIIQDIPQDDLRQYHVEILDINTPNISLLGILNLLYKHQNMPPCSHILQHRHAPDLARFFQRMMMSWPVYDENLRSFLSLAEESSLFREELFEGIASSATNCHDRPLYFFSRLSVITAAYQAEKNRNPRELIQSLLALKYLDYIDYYAQKASQGEAIEVALYLQLQLQSQLHLPIAIQSMAFNEFAQKAILNYLKMNPKEPQTVEKWVQKVRSKCLEATATRNQHIDILCEMPYFQKRNLQDFQSRQEYKRTDFLYHAAMDLLLNTKEDTDFEILFDDSELEQLNINLDQILSLAKEALPLDKQNAPFSRLNEQEQKVASDNLMDKREKALTQIKSQLIRQEVENLLNLAEISS